MIYSFTIWDDSTTTVQHRAGYGFVVEVKVCMEIIHISVLLPQVVIATGVP